MQVSGFRKSSFAQMDYDLHFNCNRGWKGVDGQCCARGAYLAEGLCPNVVVALEVTLHTINHLPAFPEIVQIGLDLGVTALGNLVFLTKDEARWQSLARQKAMKDALVKAQDYAEAAEVKLGQLISLSDRLPERGGPPGFLSAQRSLSEAGIVPQDVAFRQSVIA